MPKLLGLGPVNVHSTYSETQLSLTFEFHENCRSSKCSTCSVLLNVRDRFWLYPESKVDILFAAFLRDTCTKHIPHILQLVGNRSTLKVVISPFHVIVSELCL